MTEYTQAAAGAEGAAAGPGEGQSKAEDDVVDAEIVDDEKPKHARDA